MQTAMLLEEPFQASNPTLDNWIEDGIRHHQEGRLRDARAAYEAVLAASPDNPTILSLLGLTLHQSGDSSGGIALMRRAVSLAPDAAALRDHLGLALDGLGQAEAAMEAHATAVILDQNYAPGWYNLGMLLLRADRDAEALRCFAKALDLDSQSPIYRTGLGRVLTKLGHLPEAAEALRLALLVDPGFIDAYEVLAKLWLRLRDEEAAQEANDAARGLREGAELVPFALARTIIERIEGAFVPLAHH